MPGIRIQHTTHRNVRFNIVEGDRPYPVPYVCSAPEFGGCGSTHMFKTHHLNLDETGSVIISDSLFKRIESHLAANGFRMTNTVRKPPTITLGVGQPVPGQGSWGNIPIIVGK